MSTNLRPEIDYRALYLATQDALYAIERGVLVDFWPAYERMHDAAAMGPMVWTGKPTTAAFAVSGNKATLIAGNLDLVALGRIVRGLARNIESEDRFSAWKTTDHVVHGARRIYLFGLRHSVADLVERIAMLKDDQSSKGLQDRADYCAQMKNLHEQMMAESLVAGLANDAVVLS